MTTKTSARANGARSNAVALRRNLLAVAIAHSIAGAHAATITVNNATDASSGSHCTLRDAIVSANSDSATGGCTAGSGTDTIEFSSGVLDQTITLGGSAISITSPLTVNGPGADRLTVSANGQSRVFLVDDSAGTDAVVAVNGVRLTGGNSGRGGAILNREALTLTGVEVTGSASTGVGGGISNDGDAILNLIDSTVSGNQAATSGGGIDNGGSYQQGIVSLRDTTISGNSAASGGGLFVQAVSRVIANNATISGNSAGTGGGLYGYTFANITLYDTIIANSSAGGDCALNSAQVTSTNTLIEDGSCSANATNFYSGDPALGPLQDNGGPTLTHALMDGSVAIDSGSGACDTVDQRGLTRSDAGCDIGAFEAGPHPAIVVNSAGDTTADDGACTLREAVTAANTDTASGASAGECGKGFEADTITFDGGLSGSTITLGGSEIAITSPIAMTGPGSDSLTVSGNNASRIFLIDGQSSGATVSIEDVTLTAGAAASGGAIYNRESLTLTRVALTGNTATARGGAIQQQSGGSTTIVESDLSGNVASSGYGGAAYAMGAPISITDSTLTGNSARLGGALYATGGSATLSISNSTLADNTAGNAGGAVYGAYAALVTLDSSTLSDNTAANRGGAVALYYNGATARATDTTFSANSAGSNGGAAYAAYDTRLELTHATLAGNSAAVGAGISSDGSSTTLSLRNSIIAGGLGGDDCEGSPTYNVNLNNLVEDGTCSGSASSQVTGDPILGPLQDNGGTTETHAVLSGSPVIEAGDSTSCTGLTTDQTGMPRPIDGDADGSADCDIGSFEFVDIYGPAAVLNSAPDVSSSGGNSYDIVVNYSDDGRIDTGSIDASDLAVTGPGGAVGVTGVAPNGAGTTVTYTITPPGGSWDAADNGTYNIALAANQVFDLAVTGVNAAAAGALGDFDVAVGEIDVLGNAISISDGDTTPGSADGTDFDAVLLGNNVVRTFTIRNTGLGTVNLTTALTVTGQGFVISQPATTALGAGASTTFDVTFTPAALGVVNGVVTIANDDSDENPYTFSVTGRGAEPDIDVLGNAVSIGDGDTTPDAADHTDFGDTALGQPLMRTFTIRNEGAGVINLSVPVTVSGAGFSTTQPGSTALAAGQSTTFDVTFDANTNGPASGTVTINSDDADENPYTFALAANVVPPEIDVTGNGVSIVDGDTTPDSVDGTSLGNVTVGDFATQTFTITNVAQGTIDITGAVTVSGVGFSVTQPSQTSLGAGESTTFDVTFRPSVEGRVSGTVSFANSDADENPYDFSVAGIGTPANSAPVLNDAEFSFTGDAPPGSAIGQLNATDPDDNIPAVGAYQILSGNDDGAFSVDDEGVIRIVDSALVTQLVTELTVQVTDAGGLSDTATVTVEFLDVVFANGFE